MKSFAERLTFLWNDAKPTQIAKDLNLSISGVLRIIEKDTIPKADTLILIKKLKNCDWEWLMTGEGEPFPNSTDKPIFWKKPTDTKGNVIDIEEFVFIPYYDIQASAGSGLWANDEKQKNSLAFRRDWLGTFVSRNFEQLSVISVKGDSMSGVLEDRDTILIDHTQTQPQDGLFALRIGSDVFVKRVQRFPNSLFIKSANPEYEPFEINLSEETDESIAIIGKVVWLRRRI